MIDKIIKVCEAKGYKFFDSGEFNLNIIGVRSSVKTPNGFDDTIHFIFKDKKGILVISSFPATTDPGLDYLKNPINPNGTAILVPGQYPGMWQIGFHQNKYEALVQAKPVKVYRDNDKDAEFDLDPKSIDSGLFGINMHHAYDKAIVAEVGKWSAGCQVIQYIEDFNYAMFLCRKGAANWGNNFTYTLLEEKDLG